MVDISTECAVLIPANLIDSMTSELLTTSWSVTKSASNHFALAFSISSSTLLTPSEATVWQCISRFIRKNLENIIYSSMELNSIYDHSDIAHY